MTRTELEHVIRAAGTIANSKELVIVGSQAILGAFADAPPELTISVEVDTYPADDPSRADLIDGSIGEKSPFHDTFGYYAHGVAPETAVLPKNWRARVIRVQNANTLGIAGLCISPVDLATSKLVAGREKDFEFVSGMLKHRLVSIAQLQPAIEELDVPHRELVHARLHRCSAAIKRD